MRNFKAAGLAVAFCFGAPAFAGEGHSGKDMQAHGKQLKGMQKMEAKAKQNVQTHKAWLEQNVKDWPEKTKGVIATTIDAYGPPQEQTATMLVWHDVGPWKKTVIFKEEVNHDFPMPHKDVMEQWVNYEVPTDKFDDLAAYDGSVMAERTKGVLSARCDKEPANFLALNLANDVATGTKTVDHARKHYADAIAKMLKTGEMDPYMTGLKFKTMQAAAGDSDRVAPQVQQLGIGGAGNEGMSAEEEQMQKDPKPMDEKQLDLKPMK